MIFIYTNGGGEGVLASDALESLGFEIDETPEDLKLKLKNILPDFSSLHNPIDTTASCPEDNYLEGLKIVLEDERTEGVLVILLPQLPSFTLNFPEKFQNIYKNLNKKIPIAFVVYGGEYTQKIREGLERFVPVFDYPDEAAKSLKFIIDIKKKFNI